MASAVTNEFRNILLDLFKGDFDSAGTKYYVAIGRSDEYTAATSNVHGRSEQFDFRNTIQSVKVASNISFVVPTVEWASATTYSAYDDKLPNQTNFYVLNSSNEVFICVESTGSGSTIEPTSTLAGNSATTFATSDGYKWRFMYKMTGLAYSNFKSNSYMPVKTIVGTPTVTEEVAQKSLQDSAVVGEILSLAIDSAGTDYTSVPTITVSGNGSIGAAFTAELSGGGISKVTVDSDAAGNYYHGVGYDYASISLSTGNALLRPVFGPVGGLSADPVVSLKSKQIMIQTDIQDNETDTIVAEATAGSFQQVALIRNPKKYNSDSDFTGNTGIGMKQLTAVITGGTPTQIPSDTIISAGSVSAKVYWHDESNTKVYYYQDKETGFGDFGSGDVVSDGTRSGTITSISAPDLDIYSGEILYLNNITAIDRASNQTEDFRIVIQLG